MAILSVMAMLFTKIVLGEEKKVYPDFISPVSIEAGEIVAPAIDVAPATYFKGQIGVGGGGWDVGRASYSEVFSKMIFGINWSPSILRRRFSIGLDFSPLLLHSLHTSVPPAIDEWHSECDLSDLRLALSGLAWVWNNSKRSMALGLRPYFRMTFPTDTSRWNTTRIASPIRRVFGDDIKEHEYVGIDIGEGFAWKWKIITLYETLSMVTVAIVDSKTQFLLSFITGIGIYIGHGFELVVELDFLGRLTEAPAGAGRMTAVAACPGFRWKRKKFEISLESRIGLGIDSEPSYGDGSGGLVIKYNL